MFSSNSTEVFHTLSWITISIRLSELFYKKYFKDVSREFDEFQVNNHLCKLRYWYL